MMFLALLLQVTLLIIARISGFVKTYTLSLWCDLKKKILGGKKRGKLGNGVYIRLHLAQEAWSKW